MSQNNSFEGKYIRNNFKTLNIVFKIWQYMMKNNQLNNQEHH